MQSEPFEVSSTVPSTNIFQVNQEQPAQYGLDNDESQVSGRHVHGGQHDSVSRYNATVGEAAPANAVIINGTLATPSGRLSADFPSKACSPVDRIAEYESALLHSVSKKEHGPGFKVVQKSQRRSNGSSAIAGFPNELLTHILSHLSPTSLSAVSLVSRRFHSLVTTPHAWRVAFSRFFPGPDSLAVSDDVSELYGDDNDDLKTERRVFTRLTALASWRSEYILRTRLLRSLGRGKPLQGQSPAASGSSRSGSGHSGNTQTTYSSNLSTPVNHMQATFGTGLNQRMPRFIHGADEGGLACSSDPNNGKVDHWGFADPQSFLQFADRFPGDMEYGLGAGNVAGVPNSMDISQAYGMVYAEGSPGGMVYYRSTEEQRGRFLAFSLSTIAPDLGIPKVDGDTESMCSVWIAKTSGIPMLTEGLIGIMSGSSHGVVTSYSLGTNTIHERRIERGEITARWVLSPGVPIISIVVDENYSPQRLAHKRIWAVALNALGEIFYIMDLPTRPFVERAQRLNESALEQLSWETGRTVYWSLAEPTRRVARPDPFDRSSIIGTYSPRTSWNGMGLSKQQIRAETHEIETYMKHKPKHFRKVCQGWDMRRRLEVDFAGDDEGGAREGIVVIGCGVAEGNTAYIKRFTRCFATATNEKPNDIGRTQDQTVSPNASTVTSLFGGVTVTNGDPGRSPHNASPHRPSSAMKPSEEGIEEWHTSEVSFGGLKSVQITTAAIDMSIYALLTIAEDPILSMTGSSIASSPASTPLGQISTMNQPSDLPGQRARFLAAGTKTGTIFIWNLRAPIAMNSVLVNIINPVRVIHTDSPQISCLALSALYLVHGGNDGLVQAWDPLASNTQPIRTLNSRFSSRARRRLIQAEASIQGVGINLFAAGAVCLDPDPTVLRGMVSLGTHLRYWSYSSSAAEQYKSSKRRLRRSERGSNQGGERISGTGRGVLKEYIANERLELEREKEHKRKEEERLAGRFGVDLLGPGASEDEILAYATLLSEEALVTDEQRKKSESEGSTGENVMVDVVNAPTPPQSVNDREDDTDIAEAIRLSLQEADTTSGTENSFFTDIPIRYAKSRKFPSSTSADQGIGAGSSRDPEAEDLDFALQLSLAEERSKRQRGAVEEFPVLAKSSSSSPTQTGSSKGKGKRQAS
ncbi:hypothetical protein MMC08_007387 [Hypocenomyce scalaris]|nr:hypothetical protein [Hypocenomyce scalaris]